MTISHEMTFVAGKLQPVLVDFLALLEKHGSVVGMDTSNLESLANQLHDQLDLLLTDPNDRDE